jgi:hypothetical protein
MESVLENIKNQDKIITDEMRIKTIELLKKMKIKENQEEIKDFENSKENENQEEEEELKDFENSLKDGRMSNWIKIWT